MPADHRCGSRCQLNVIGAMPDPPGDYRTRSESHLGGERAEGNPPKKRPFHDTISMDRDAGTHVCGARETAARYDYGRWFSVRDRYGNDEVVRTIKVVTVSEGIWLWRPSTWLVEVKNASAEVTGANL